MVDFFQNNWKEILEIVISVVLGFMGGYTYKGVKSKNVSKIKGNYNAVIQKGGDNNGNIK